MSARGFTSVFCVLMMFLAILFIGRLPYAKRLAPKNLAPKTRARRLTGSCCAYTNVNYKPWVRFPHTGVLLPTPDRGGVVRRRRVVG